MTSNLRFFLTFTLTFVLRLQGELGAAPCISPQAAAEPGATIPFKKFERSDPITSEYYADDDLITIEDDETGHRTVRAKDFFDDLDRTEESLNKIGLSLRTPSSDDSASELSRLAECARSMSLQAQAIDSAIRNAPPQNLRTTAEWAAYTKELYAQLTKDVPSYEELVRLADDQTYERYLPEPPPFSPKIRTIAPLDIKLSKQKSWPLELGSKSNLWLGIYPSLAFGATKLEAQAVGDLNLRGAMLGIWEGQIARLNLFARSPGTGPLSVLLSASMLEGKKTWSYPLTSLEPIKFDDHFKEGVSHSTEYRFSIGPIPMVAEIGFRGEVGFRYGLNVFPLSIQAYSGPYASADMFAQAGADIYVLAVGVGGQVRLIDLEMLLQGNVHLEFVDEPVLKMQVAGTLALEALSGELYAYVKYPTLTGRKEKKRRFHSWAGYSKEGTIFDYRATLSRSGMALSGDIEPEDVLEEQHWDREARLKELAARAHDTTYRTMAAIHEDTTSAAAHLVSRRSQKLKAIDEGLGGQLQGLKQTLEAWAGR